MWCTLLNAYFSTLLRDPSIPSNPIQPLAPLCCIYLWCFIQVNKPDMATTNKEPIFCCLLPWRKANQILLSATMYRFQNISKIHCCWQSQNHLFVVCLRIFDLLWLLFSDVGFCRITLKKDWGWVWSAGFWWFWVCLKKWCCQQQHLLIMYSCTEWWFENRP